MLFFQWIPYLSGEIHVNYGSACFLCICCIAFTLDDGDTCLEPVRIWCESCAQSAPCC
jgi:hypothetical protein